MANPYPANFTDETGRVRLEGDIDFTDSGNQPVAAALQTVGPFTVNFDDAGLTTIGVTLHTFTTPVLLLTATWVPVVQWAGTGAVPFEVTGDPSTTNFALWGSADVSGFTSLNATWPTPVFNTSAGEATVLACDASGSINLTAGQARVYAFYAAL